MKKIIVFLFLIVAHTSYAQRPTKKLQAIEKSSSNSNQNNTGNDSNNFGNNSNKNIKKNEEAKITDYLIISRTQDTTYVDTTLNLHKNYKFNYLRKDNFELLQFANIGQTYNTLGYDFKSTRLMPEFGARSKHFNYMEVDDIHYYHVPTPLTELFFKTAFKQGQLLDAFFTTNTSKQFNASIAYKGLRSLGNYQQALTSTGNFRMTASYKTKNDRYIANVHFVSQDILNRENGGLLDSNIELFTSGDEDVLDRARLEVNFEDGEGILKGKRTYLNHYYKLKKGVDSLNNNEIRVGHVFNLEDKNYSYTQTTPNDFFGEARTFGSISDIVKLEELYNELNLSYNNRSLGLFQFNASHTNYNYGYNRILVQDNNIITNRIKGDVFAVGGKYQKTFKYLNIFGEVGANVSGDFTGNFVLAKAEFNVNEDLKFLASLNNNTVAPNYNAQLFQSDYTNYNWQNNFNTIKTQQLDFEVKSKKWVNAKVQASTINDYVYFEKDIVTEQVRPFQNDKSISYLKVRLDKDIRYKHFGLHNTIQYQTVDDENEVFNVPEFITRNTLYYENFAFKKAMYFQTGVTLNYFTQYHINDYNPLLSEFYVQREIEIGNFPRLDFFIDAKIRQTRLFLKLEHFNAAFTGREYFTAPNYPYRDFIVRFGLVWNFFL